jgi:prepilin-type N-terminal cleavage/methylation domain-containing protein
MKHLRIRDFQGFTLIELLVVVLMISIVIGSIYSLYITHQRTAYVQDEVVEVQQNLRIAMDSIARDIRLAGFLAPGYPVNAVSYATGTAATTYLPSADQVNSDTLALNIATGLGSALATIMTATTTISSPIPVDSVLLPDNTQKFYTNNAVTIIRQQDKSQPAGSNVFMITSADTANSTVTLSGTLPSGFTGFKVGDIITKLADTYTGSAYSATSTITYFLADHSAYSACPAGAGQLCLMRSDSSDGSGAQVVAQNIANLRFSYLMDGGSLTQESANPTSYNKIRAVRVKLLGQTVSTKALSGGIPRVRILESVIHFRNRI